MEQQFTESERQRLIKLAIAAIIKEKDEELTSIIAKLVGVDTVIVARRAYLAMEDQ